MSNLGDYQWMTTEAKKHGNPEQWLNAIKDVAYKQGASDMKQTLVLPLLATGATGICLGAVGVLGFQKIKNRIESKKEQYLIYEQEATIAEEYLKQELQDALSKVESENGEQIE